jgi:polysaccharide biosynthesis transport protein
MNRALSVRNFSEARHPAASTGGAEAYDGGYRPLPGTEHMPLRDYVRVIYRRRWIIAAIILAGLLTSMLYNATATPIFEAAATLQIGADPNVLGLERPLVDQRDWMREFLPTQLGILESRELASMARAELQQPDGAGPGRPKLDIATSDIVDGRTITPLSNTRLVSIGFRSTDPVQAAEVANALGRAYVKWNTVSKSSTTGEASDWLKKQVEEQRKVVQASEAALQRYKREQGAEALGERQNVVVQKLADLQGAVTRASAETIEKETQYRQVLQLQSNRDALDTVPAIASNAFIHDAKQELSGLQQQLAQASEQLGELHPEIVRLRAAIANAERKLGTEISKAAAVIRNDYESARARERALAGAFERQKLEVQGLNAKAVEYTAFDRTATANRLLLDNLEQRSKQITLARDLPSASTSVLDPAEVPGAPVSPRKQRNLMFGVGGSATLALAVVFLLELFNTRVTSPDDVRKHLRLPVIGVTPRVHMEKGSALLVGEGAPPQFTELLHGVRTNLVVSPELAATRTLLVTSSEPGEGKTMAAANLAVSLARLKQRVLLIDADLRSPRLHQVFGVEQRPGLGDVLAHRGTSSAFRKTKVAGLWLMPSGNVSQNPTDLLGSERFGTLIEYLRGQFDWVILDSPPVLAVTDPCLIARAVSGVLFVVGSGQTARDVATAAVDRLDAVGAHLVGVMLNRAVLPSHGDSYLPYYHQQYDGLQPPREDGLWRPDGAPDRAESSVRTAHG